MDALELKIPPVAQVVVIAGLMWLLAENLPQLSIVTPCRYLVSVLCVLGGATWALAGVLAFRAVTTTVDPTRPDSSSTIVTSGVYRWSRNPMYLGFLLLLTGWAVYLSHALAFVFLPVFVCYMNRFQIRPEERALRRIFGEQYQRYRASVRRWI
jgi:protein-S-isoprenylcysteine O-methyltransferase Ste14